MWGKSWWKKSSGTCHYVNQKNAALRNCKLLQIARGSIPTVMRTQVRWHYNTKWWWSSILDLIKISSRIFTEKCQQAKEGCLGAQRMSSSKSVQDALKLFPWAEQTRLFLREPEGLLSCSASTLSLTQAAVPAKHFHLLWLKPPSKQKELALGHLHIQVSQLMDRINSVCTQKCDTELLPHGPGHPHCQAAKSLEHCP